MTKFKNVFLLAAMAVSAVFVACDKENEEGTGDPANTGNSLKDSTLTLTKDGVTTTISFTSADSLTAVVGGVSQRGSYTFVGSTLTLIFGETTISLTKSDDGTFTGGGYTVTSGGDDPAGGNTTAFDGKIQAEVSVPDGIGVQIATIKVEGGEEDWNLAKSAKYENGTLTVELLNPVPSEFLELRDGVKMASPHTGLEAYGDDGNYLGSFRYQNADGAVKFIYVESDVTINGAPLQKGWNKVFLDDKTNEGSTTIPSVEWIFRPNSAYEGGNDPVVEETLDDWDGKIVAVVSIGDVPVDEVVPTGGTGNWNLSTTAKYENGTLTIELLDPVPDAYLEGLSTFNAPDVQGTWLHTGIDANYNGSWTGYYFRQKNASISATYFYLKTDGIVYGIPMKKGWNRIFFDRETEQPTTTDPGWVFEQYNP